MYIHSIISSKLMNTCYTFLWMCILDEACIMIYICTSISFANTYFESEELNLCSKNLYSFYHIIKKMNIYHTFMQMLISGKACIMLHSYTNILLVNTNFDWEQTDADMKNILSLNHINKTNECLVYIPIKDFYCVRYELCSIFV